MNNTTPKITPRTVTTTLGRSSKTVQLRYEVNVVGQKTIDKICKAYNSGLQISDIVKMVNGPMNLNTSLNLADIYCILYHAVTYSNYTTVEVKQRIRFREFEISLRQVKPVIDAWMKGIKKKDIYAIANPIAVDRICHSLYCRASSSQAKLKQLTEGSAVSLLSEAKREVIDGKDCLVIFMDDISDDLYKKCFPTQQESSSLTDEEIVKLNSIKLKDHGESPPTLENTRPLEVRGRDLERFIRNDDELEAMKSLPDKTYCDDTEDKMFQDLEELADQSISHQEAEDDQPLTDDEKRKKLEDLFS